jgi:hypothetical protein
MLKPRTCPHCKQIVPFDRGFVFDDHLNMICLQCNNKIISIKIEEIEQNRSASTESIDEI